MAKKTIITIGRQFGSGGHKVGEKLAKELGIKFYDKELIKLMAKKSGLCEKVLESYDEKPMNSLLYSIVMDVYPSVMYSGPTIDQQIYQACYDTIRHVAEEGSCIIVGRSADYVLRDYRELISVFFHADDAFRIERIKEEYHITDDKARDMMIKTDKKRASYYNFQSEKKWGMASSYNICLDTSILGIDGAVKLLLDYVGYVQNR